MGNRLIGIYSRKAYKLLFRWVSSMQILSNSMMIMCGKVTRTCRSTRILLKSN